MDCLRAGIVQYLPSCVLPKCKNRGRSRVSVEVGPIVLHPRIVVVKFSIDEWKCMLLVEIQTHADADCGNPGIFLSALSRCRICIDLQRLRHPPQMCFSHVVSMSPNSVECNPLQCKYCI